MRDAVRGWTVSSGRGADLDSAGDCIHRAAATSPCRAFVPKEQLTGAALRAIYEPAT